MKVKLLILLILRDKYLIDSSEEKERGGSLVVSMMVGFLLMILSSIILANSSNLQINTKANEFDKQANSSVEGAFSRYLDFLSQYPELAVFCAYSGGTESSCNTGTTWASITGGTNLGTATSYCTNTTDTITSSEADMINTQALTTWKEFQDGTQYRLISYTYQPDSGVADNQVPGKGILVLEGANNDVEKGVTRLQYTIPITENTNAVECPIPGVWVPSTGTVQVSPHTNGSINAIVRKTGSAPSSTDFVANSLYGSSIYDGTTAPSVDATTMTMPSIPNTIPTPYHTLPVLDLSGCTIKLPRLSEDNASGLCSSSIDNAFNDLESTDQSDADGRYHYIIESTASLGGDSIKLSNSAIMIQPPAGEKVVLWVKGNITASGTGTNGTNPAVSLATSATRDTDPSDQNGLGCELTSDTTTAAITTFINQGSAQNLEIYGADGTASWTGGYTSTTVSISSNTRINAFMLFPNALIQVSQGLISGAVWANSFDFSNTSACTVGMIQNKVGDVLAANTSYPTTNLINPVASRERQERP